MQPQNLNNPGSPPQPQEPQYGQQSTPQQQQTVPQQFMPSGPVQQTPAAMPTQAKQSKKPMIIICALVILIIGVVALYFGVLRDKHPSSAEQTAVSQTSQSSGVDKEQLSEAANAKNVSKKNDVSKLSAAIGTFTTNNNGKVPTGWENGNLVGASSASVPQPTNLKIYGSVSFAQDEQTPLTKDIILVVTGAACAEDGSTTSAGSRAVAIQYVTESVNNTLSAECQDI